MASQKYRIPESEAQTVKMKIKEMARNSALFSWNWQTFGILGPFSVTKKIILLLFYVLCPLAGADLHTHISKASNLVMCSFLRVHVSAQYKVTLQISVFAILFLRHLFNPLHSIRSHSKSVFSPFFSRDVPVIHPVK